MIAGLVEVRSIPTVHCSLRVPSCTALGRSLLNVVKRSWIEMVNHEWMKILDGMWRLGEKERRVLVLCIE